MVHTYSIHIDSIYTKERIEFRVVITIIAFITSLAENFIPTHR